MCVAEVSMRVNSFSVSKFETCFKIFLKYFYLFLERGGREKEGEKHQSVRETLIDWSVAPHCILTGAWGTEPTTPASALTGKPTSKLLALQDNTQTTKPHPLRLAVTF